MRANYRALLVFLFAIGWAAAYYFGFAAGRESISARSDAVRASEQIRMRTPGDPAPVSATEIPVDPRPTEARLHPPLPNLRAKDIQDSFHQARGPERMHEATDILAPRGTPVYAVVTGVIKRLFNSKPGGLTIYQFDKDQEFCYYYAHLDGYAPGIREGEEVQRGTTIGYVGTTGNAPPGTPHLHFAIFRLGPEQRWWEGTPINPYPLLLESLK